MASQGKGAKTKGSSYELKIAKKFSDWWGGKFNRTPGSGSLNWGSDQRVAGDIVPPQGLTFPFVIECKKHEDWTMDHVLLDIGDPRKWWKQVVTDARSVNLVPMLIFSRNRAKDFIMLPYTEEFYNGLKELGQDIMRTSVSMENIRDEKQVFDVIVTTYDTLSKASITYLIFYAKGVDWDPYAEDYKA